MNVIFKGSNIDREGVVHRVTNIGEGKKMDGSDDVYSYSIACEEEPAHVAFNTPPPCETASPLSCLVCIATGTNGDRR